MWDSSAPPLGPPQMLCRCRMPPAMVTAKLSLSYSAARMLCQEIPERNRGAPIAARGALLCRRRMWGGGGGWGGGMFVELRSLRSCRQPL